MNERGEKIIGIIPARGGSKQLARKNLRALAGKSLLEWAMETCVAAISLDERVVSSDDAEILKRARGFGKMKTIERPAELATDGASSVDVALHALEIFPGYDWIVLLQPTSPLRMAEDIEAAIRTAVHRDAPACVSVTAAREHPYFSYYVGENGGLRPFCESAEPHVRRQDTPPAYRLNGAVYLARTDFLMRARSFLTPQTIAYVMPDERSLDIDTGADLEMARKRLTETLR